MNIGKLVNSTKKMVSDNSPVILTAIGVTGTITTAILTAKATFRAARIIDDAQFKENIGKDKLEKHDLETKEKVKLVWKEYVPAVATGVGTVTCIIGANYIGTKRAAALAAAYSLSEKAIGEYKEKVIEKLGEEQEAEIRQEIAQERVLDNPPPSTHLIPGHGDIIIHDAYTNRYFMSNKVTVEKAQNSINYDILKNDWKTLTDFYDRIGLEPTSISDEMGWNSESQLELLWSPIETPDGRAGLSFDFATIPIHKPWTFPR